MPCGDEKDKVIKKKSCTAQRSKIQQIRTMKGDKKTTSPNRNFGMD